MENNKISSYSSADTFPVKLLHCKNLVDEYRRIRPIHIQLNLTNKCNLKCSFCSCQNRDQTIELDFDKAKKIIDTYKELGCQAVTITGGGEPILYKKLPEIIKLFSQAGIKIGLVTNGLNIDKVQNLNMLTWLRVSFDDNRFFSGNFVDNLILAVTNNCKVDWSFSYVVSNNPNFTNLKMLVEFANKYRFTHIRIVSDLLDIDNVPDMDLIKNSLTEELFVDDSRVIYQGRKVFTHGRKKCLISLLKPVITVEGDIYPCCGAQYAKKSNMYNYDESMKMGTVDKAKDIFYKQNNFDGHYCDKCYYDKYNIALDNMTSDLNHLEFV